MATEKAPPDPAADQPFLTLAQQLEKTPPCQAQCPNSGDVRGWLGVIAQRDSLGPGHSALHTPVPAAGLGVDNHIGYSSPDVDRLLAVARTAPTLPDRRQALQRVMERVMADLPMVPLVVPHDLYVVRHDVRWTPRLDGRVLAADLARAPEGGP